MEPHRTDIMTGMFRDRDSAERAWSSLSGRGYGRDDVSLLMSEEWTSYRGEQVYRPEYRRRDAA